MTPGELSKQVQTREDFIRLVKGLAQDFESSPETWENPTLNQYLEAIAAWTADSDGYFANRVETAPDSPSWRLFALILQAAKIYE